MAAAPRGKITVTPAAVTKDEAPELPIVQCLGLAKTPRGWVVIGLTVQGDRVLEREVLSEPEPVGFAAERMKTEVVKAYVLPTMKVGA